MVRPLCVDLFCGLFGWGAGFSAEGYHVIGFDIADMGKAFGVPRPPNCDLVIQDILTLHGAQLKEATAIVASPPCQAYSYMAMPFTRGKRMAAYYDGSNEDWSIFGDELDDRDDDSEYRSQRRCQVLNTLFKACFQIQREASEAAGHHIPLIVENVRGAQAWVGLAKAHYGSFYLWGDVDTVGNKIMCGPRREWLRAPSSRSYAVKVGGDWFSDPLAPSRQSSSKSNSRKAASAQIAKIPFPLAKFMAKCFKP